MCSDQERTGQQKLFPNKSGLAMHHLTLQCSKALLASSATPRRMALSMQNQHPADLGFWGEVACNARRPCLGPDQEIFQNPFAIVRLTSVRTRIRKEPHETTYEKGGSSSP
jgi:hypothetical protein